MTLLVPPWIIDRIRGSDDPQLDELKDAVRRGEIVTVAPDDEPYAAELLGVWTPPSKGCGA